MQFVIIETSLVVQWLRLCDPNAGGLGSTPGEGTRSHMLQLRAHTPQLKILHPATETQGSRLIIIIIILTLFPSMKSRIIVSKNKAFHAHTPAVTALVETSHLPWTVAAVSTLRGMRDAAGWRLTSRGHPSSAPETCLEDRGSWLNLFPAVPVTKYPKLALKTTETCSPTALEVRSLKSRCRGAPYPLSLGQILP